MMDVEEAEDPVPGEAMEIHDDHTGKSRRGRIEPVARAHTHDVAPRDEYRGSSGRERGRGARERGGEGRNSGEK